MHDKKRVRTKHPFWQRIEGWLHHHHTLTYVITGIGIVLAASLIAFSILYETPHKIDLSQPFAIKKEKPVPPKFFSPLTGQPVADEAATKAPVTAIMLENSPDARPQSGLKDSGVVFEAIAEGGITRFLVLYQQQKPALIGPVRSVRLYYVQWAAPFNASIAHIGGSAFALKEVRNGSYRDIDQFFNAGAYWRARDRYAPHNVYSSFARLDALNAAKGYTSSPSVQGFSRKDPAPSKTPNAKTINVGISGPLYNSSYIYDAASNTYLRSQGGAPHVDREHGQIAPNTVIVMNVDMKLIFEDGYREQITTVGSGKATIFQDGMVTVGTWNKPTVGAQITFTGPDGKDIPLNRGQTWITAIPNGKGSVSWQ